MPSTPTQLTPSSNVYLNALQWGGWAWTDPNPRTNIAYHFAPFGVDLGGAFGAGWGTSASWLSYEQAAYRQALQTWANVANITFTEVFSYGLADLVEHITAGHPPGVLAIHETPEHAFTADGTAWGAYGSDGRGWTQAGLLAGGFGFTILVHELGHALGLAHPHDHGGGSGTFPGVTAAFNDYGDNNLNQGIFTVMSYNYGWPTGTGVSSSDNYGWQATPMAFDIAAIQYLYGANMSHHTGDDTYSLPDSNGPGAMWACIWDAGGTDQIVYNGSGNAIIDLTAATLDNSPTGGGVPGYVQGVIGGFTIANGVVIENAWGDSGNDEITGNNAANVLVGRAGNDTMNGLGGNDYFYGGDGQDTLNGSSGIDVFLGEADRDIIYGGDDQDYIYGGTGTNNLYGGDSVDVIISEGSSDSSIGGNEGDHFYAFVGSSTPVAWGEEGNDIYVDFANGADTFYGGNGQDYFYGFGGNDYASGGAGVDVFLLDDGNDTIDPGSGTDYAWGGNGTDTYLMNSGSGILVIKDFVSSVDHIALTGLGFSSFSEVQSSMTYFADINTTILTIDSDSNIWFIGLDSSQFTAADFSFS